MKRVHFTLIAFSMFFILFKPLTIRAFPLHILDLIYFENPATLNRVKKCEINLGDHYWDSEFKYKGTSFGETGAATSHTDTHFPYGQIAYRFDEKLVFGITYLKNFHIVNINWGCNSLVRFASSKTFINSYRVAGRMSYQLIDSLSVGASVDVQRLYDVQLNFAVPGEGNMKNRSKTSVYIGYEIGAFYVCNKCTFLNSGFYIAPSLKKSRGKSTTQSGLINDNYALDVPDAYEFYLQLIRVVNDKWTLAGKFNYSNWTILSFLDLENTAVGDVFIPTNWKDTLTFEGIAQYNLNKNWVLIGGGQYVIRFANTKDNLIAFPASNLMVAVGGFNYQISDCLGTQFIYTYGWYSPQVKIDSTENQGRISLSNHALHLKLTYAW